MKLSYFATKEFPIIAIVLVGVVCLLCTLGLLVGAFAAVPDAEVASAQCVASAASVYSESFQTLLLFASGYICTLAAKRRHDIAMRVHGMCQQVTEATYALCSRATSMINFVNYVRQGGVSLPQPSWINKGTVAIILASTLCTLCVVALLISAFMAEPDADPTDTALVSESSQAMRVFTVGWMFIMAFKLRRELVGLVGSCCLLQPW